MLRVEGCPAELVITAAFGSDDTRKKNHSLFMPQDYNLSIKDKAVFSDIFVI